MHPFEIDYIRRCLDRALRSEEHTTRRNRALRGSHVAWIAEKAEILGLSPVSFDPEIIEDLDRPAPKPALDAMKPFLSELRRSVAGNPPKPSPLEKRLRWFSALLGLDNVEAALTGLLVRRFLQQEVASLIEMVANARHGFGLDEGETQCADLAMLLGIDRALLDRALLPQGNLRLLGVVKYSHSSRFCAAPLIVSIARQNRLDEVSIRNLLLARSSGSNLVLEDFGHLGAMADLVERTLADAFEHRRNGINILFHGEPGTGKTEFAKLMGDRLGVSVTFAGEGSLADDDGRIDEIDRVDRMGHLALARIVAGRAGQAMVVVDEADDVFTGVDEDDGGSRQGSKVFVNRLVERAEAPTIWITNAPHRLGDAVIRRMTLVVEFPKPPLVVRRRIIERIGEKEGFALTAVARDRIARLEVAPAILENGIRVAARLGDGADTIVRVVETISRAMDGREVPPLSTSGPFDPKWSRADQDLVTLTETIAKSPTRALSFLLSGPPGTGKSAWVRHLAERLGIEVLEMRASDLIDKYVGETEQRIARAFREASATRSFLVFDEADSLLRTRSGAQHTWEVTQVNEMLTWMERHPQPFACTTNALDAIDPAALRRFIFKVKFLAMDAPAIEDMFAARFDAVAPQRVRLLTNLTPGDFAVVARKAEVFAERDANRLADWLFEEAAAKPEGGLRRIGFR